MPHGNSTPVVTLTDAWGTSGNTYITSANGRAGGAANTMFINVDTSIEPELISGTSVTQGNCNANGSCIRHTAGQLAAATGAPVTGPTTAYFKIACTSASSAAGLLPSNTGRWSREFIVTASSGSYNLTIYSHVCTGLTCNSGGPPTCPNAQSSGATHYVVALAVDPAYSPLPGVWWPGMASGSEIVQPQGVVAMGVDFTVCASGCTQGSVSTTGTSPWPTQSQTYFVFSHTGPNQINLTTSLTSSFGQPNVRNMAVYGYDDTPAISNWLNAIVTNNPTSGATAYCPPGSYLWSSTINMGTTSAWMYPKIEGAGHAGNFGTKAIAQQGTCEFVTIGTAVSLNIGAVGVNDFGGGEISNISFREGVPGVLGAGKAPIYDNLATGMIFQDLSFTNYENSAGIILDGGSSGNFAQYNDIVRPLWSDTQTGVLLKATTADNRIWGGRFFGSRVGGGAAIASQGNGAGYLWVYGTNCQYAPACFNQYDQAGANVEMKAENTYGLGSGTAPVIGSSGTGTFAVLDGSSTSGNCSRNHVKSEQVGFFGLGLYNSANCTGTEVGMFRFKQTTTQYNDNSSYPTFLGYSITAPPLARPWTKNS